MNKTNTHYITAIFLTIAAVGMTIESIIMDWEIWGFPLIIGGIVALWLLHISQYGSVRSRENYFFVYGMFLVFMHGIHETSLFDVAIVAALMLITFTMLSRSEMPKIIMGEYVVIMILQLIMVFRDGTMEFTMLNVSKLILHFVAIVCIFLVCLYLVKGKREALDAIESSDNKTKEAEEDMEDFLTNISHELRTPVNVVNGMSTIFLNNSDSEEVETIRDAGIRLSYQIEDIQDFTENKRGDIVLEEEKYMITSLVNDVLSSFRILEKNQELEFIVDLDPNVPTMLKGDIKKLHKIIRHLIDNAVKFTKRGGIYVRVGAIPRPYGVNLIIEVTDTGSGMSRKAVSKVSTGMYQANKKRNRSTGGIGLGLNIVHGFVHKMKGFVVIESDGMHGTTVRVAIPQEVIDSTPCLVVNKDTPKNIVFYTMPEKYKIPAIRDFYRTMATHLAAGLDLNLYSVAGLEDIKEKMKVTHIFTGAEEYESASDILDMIAEEGITVAVSAVSGFKVNKDSKVIVMPKPLYGFPVVKVLNGAGQEDIAGEDENILKPMFDGIKALIVDDEPMNLVVATGLFRQYGLVTETADGGKESVDKCANNDYDIVFMDHMMPEMDGVEAMKLIKKQALDQGKKIAVVALTANVVSSAREMFQREGFDGFIAKPIDVIEFERVMKHLIPSERIRYVGRDEV